jgi:hypothetical protein
MASCLSFPKFTTDDSLEICRSSFPEGWLEICRSSLPEWGTAGLLEAILTGGTGFGLAFLPELLGAAL